MKRDIPELVLRGISAVGAGVIVFALGGAVAENSVRVKEDTACHRLAATMAEHQLCAELKGASR